MFLEVRESPDHTDSGTLVQIQSKDMEFIFIILQRQKIKWILKKDCWSAVKDRRSCLKKFYVNAYLAVMKLSCGRVTLSHLVGLIFIDSINSFINIGVKYEAEATQFVP